MTNKITIDEALDQRGFYCTAGLCAASVRDVYNDLTDLVAFRGNETQIRAWLAA